MHEKNEDLSVKSFFIPFTTTKAIHYLLLIGFVIFLNGLFNSFVQDDHAQIINKPTIHSLSNIATYFFESRLTIGEQHFIGAMYYKPLLDTTFAFIHAIGGLHAFWFHFFQIMLYITNSCLVFLLFKRFFPPLLSFLLSLVFLVHPINSEEAFYISAMQEVLFFFFGMLSLLLLKKPYSHKKLFLISIFLLCSLLSKETGILFSGIILVYAYIFQRKVWTQLIAYICGSVGIYAILRIHAIGFFTHSAAVSPIETLSLSERIFHIPSVVVFYLQTLLFPLAISSSHQWIYKTINFQNYYLPLLIVLGFILVVISTSVFIYRKYQNTWGAIYLFFMLWFVAGLSFHVQIFPLDQTVAERWFYLPFVGLLGMLGVVAKTISSRVVIKNHQLRLLGVMFIGIIIILLALKTFMRSFDFRNDFVLASTDILVSPESYNLAYILSRQYYDMGKLQEAKVYAQKSIDLFPQITNYTNLGAIYSRMGNYSLAEKSYLKALDYGNDTLPYENIASLALVHGSTNKNITFLQEHALPTYPRNGKLWFSLALLEYKNGNKSGAQKAMEKAKAYYPIPLVQYLDKAMQQNKKIEVIAEKGIVNFSVK